MRKEIKNGLIEEMLEYGKTFLGHADIRGNDVVKEYKALQKEVTKRFPGSVLCWDGFGTGEIWMK